MDEKRKLKTNETQAKRQLIFSPPTADSPGYLRRSREAMRLLSTLTASPEGIDHIVEFLLPYVEEPVDRDAGREALLDATDTQIRSLLNAIVGGRDGDAPLSRTGRRGK